MIPLMANSGALAAQPFVNIEVWYMIGFQRGHAIYSTESDYSTYVADKSYCDSVYFEFM